MTEYIVDKLLNSNLAGTNCVYVKSKSLDYIKITNNEISGIFKVVEDQSILQMNTICLNTFQRTFLGCVLGCKVKVNVISVGELHLLEEVTFVIKNLMPKQNQYIEITDETINEIKLSLINIPIISDLQLVYKNKLGLFPIEIDKNNLNKIMNEETKIKIISTDKTINIEISDTKELFKGDFNFKEMGIGGLDKQFEIVFRRAFSSRLIPDKILKNLGVNHVRGLMLYGPPGCGKCLGINTPIIMYDGTIKMVQEIEVGEQIMGDNSEPRKVLSLARGQEQMYKIIQDNGDPYIVNSSHILSLYDPKKNTIVDINIKDYLELKDIYVSPTILEGQKQNLLMKKLYTVKGGLYGFKVKTSFKSKLIPFDAYLFGKYIMNYNITDMDENYIVINDYFIKNDLDKNPKIPLEFKANEGEIQLSVL